MPQWLNSICGGGGSCLMVLPLGTVNMLKFCTSASELLFVGRQNKNNCSSPFTFLAHLRPAQPSHEWFKSLASGLAAPKWVNPLVDRLTHP